MFTPAQCAVPAKLRNLSGSWYGRLRASVPGEPQLTFCACAHDLGDAGLGVLDIDGSDGGPLQFILVVPAGRRGRTRAELAFEFVSFIRFLEGPENRGTEMALFNYVEDILNKGGGTVVFSVEARPLLAELQLLLSQQAERLVSGLLMALDDDAPGLSAAAD